MNLITQQNHLIQEAETCIRQIQDDLKSVVQLSQKKEEDDDDAGSETDNLRTLQLVLQFRLDTQDALQRLFQFNQSVWQILDLSPQYSSRMNIERLTFALGSDDLHHALSMLNRLIDSLLRVVKRYALAASAQNQASKSHKLLKTKHAPSISPRLQKMIHVVDMTKSFTFILNQLTNDLVDIPGQPVPGPVLDNIAKFEGPISHFYQALQNGLELAGGLYQQLEATCQLNKKLDELLHQSNLVLQQTTQLNPQPRLYQPSKALPSSLELEARAAEKRLGHFFRPQPGFPH
jgi:hypothetical protein